VRELPQWALGAKHSLEPEVARPISITFKQKSQYFLSIRFL